MDRFQDLITGFLKEDTEFLNKGINSIDDLVKDIQTCCKQLEKDVDLFLKTGDLPPSLHSTTNTSSKRSSTKENETINAKIPSLTEVKNKTKKNVLKDVSQVLNQELTVSSVTSEDNLPTIKSERVSNTISETASSITSDVPENNVKTEKDEMLPPTQPPPRKKKIKTEPSTRTTRTKKRELLEHVKEERFSVSNERKDSDVMVQNATITTIEISDSDESMASAEASKPSRTTRTKRGKNTAQATAECATETSRSTRTKTRQKKKNDQTEEEETKSPEVIDSSQNDVEPAVENTRSTRTKTKVKQKNSKRIRSQSSDEDTKDKVEKKRSRSDPKDIDINSTTHTQYEDAISDTEPEKQGNLQGVNATFIATNNNTKENLNDNNATFVKNNDAPLPPAVNVTVMIENPKYIKNLNNSLMTDDESFEEKEDAAKRKKPPTKSKPASTKQIFSPYENSPVKKKVEAFEKLGAEGSGIPTRVTRTKTKTHPKNEENEGSEKNLVEQPTKNIVKEKTKIFTPVQVKHTTKVCSTSKANKYLTATNVSTNNESLLSAKSASALKASQAEFREREKRRREKEKEALRKREALLMAQTEEKRKKREEKQIKAQKQREAMEKEKQRLLEIQRIKDERHKQVIAEKEEKLQKQKEEMEKKRLLAKKKADEIRKEEEECRAAEEKKTNEINAILSKQNGQIAVLAEQNKKMRENQIPIYMTMKPPLLPTEDCYDSDDPEYKNLTPRIPYWSKDYELEAMQLAMIAAGETIKNTFFCCQATTPDLQDIFKHIDPRKLKRTSSAIWKKPPRYTLMPTLDQFGEENEDSC